MKNTNKQNTDQENSDSFLNERQDVTCSEGEAVTELSPSSCSEIFWIVDLNERGKWIPILRTREGITSFLKRRNDSGDHRYDWVLREFDMRQDRIERGLQKQCVERNHQGVLAHLEMTEEEYQLAVKYETLRQNRLLEPK